VPIVLFGEDEAHGGGVDVATGDDEADAGGGTERAAEQGGKAERAAGFDDQLEAEEGEADGFTDGLFGDGDEIIDILQHEGEGELAEGWGARAVGDGGRIVDGDELAGAEGAGGIIGDFRLDADDAAVRRQAFGGDGCAGEKAAATDAGQDGLQSGNLLMEFEGGCALPGDDVGVVVGGDDGVTVLGGEVFG